MTERATGRSFYGDSRDDFVTSSLSDIPAILKMALANQTYLDEILTKLNQISQVPATPITINNAPSGFAISGGTVVNPQVTNHYGDKIPDVLGLELVKSTTPEVELPNFKQQGPLSKQEEHPTTSFKFYIDSAWNDPKYVAICDRPCHALDIRQAKPSGIMMLPNFRAGRWREYPNLAVFLVDIRPFKTDTFYLFTVASDDDQPINILRFVTLDASSKLQ